jgi:hypothetical protein
MPNSFASFAYEWVLGAASTLVTFYN